jgi:hypothetical protein
MSYKGRYKVKNTEKYRGDPTNCIFRSLWERKFMKFCDENENVISWSSEEVVVPYRSPLDGRIHRYFIDFWMKIKQKNGSVKNFLVEIKPHSQTVPPILKEGLKMTATKAKQIKTYALNTEKWRAAKNFCSDRGWEFVIMTEKQLFGKKND